MVELQRIKRKIKDGGVLIGTAVTMTDYSISELFGEVGFDFIWIDSEHSALDKKDVMYHIIAARGTGAATFVRVPWNDPVLVKPILELGPDGIIFPMIRTEEDARLAVKSCTYPPKGIRGFGPARSVRYGLMDGDEYIRGAEQAVWKILQVEQEECVDNLEAIVGVEGVDALMVGPCDLSGSVGLLGQTDHDKVKKLMDRIGEIAVKADIPLGVAMGYQPETIKEWLDRGASMFMLGVDFFLLTSGAARILKGTRDLLPS